MESQIIENKLDSIKLIKNTKGYQWEIKVQDFGIGTETLARLDRIEEYLQKKYGQIDNTQMKGGIEEI